MSRSLNAIKPSVQALRAYSLRPDRARIRLNQNENPWDAPEKIRNETVRRLNEKPWSRYPDFHARAPNKPTGCVINPGDLEVLLGATRGLVVIDEAYHEFSGRTVVPLLQQHRNLIVLRTFSKAMAMAGLRVGYLLASPELAQEIAKAVLPYNLNVISQTCAQVAIEMYESKLQPLINVICAERDRVYERLKEIKGLEPVPSRGNFMLVRSAISPRLVFDQLLRRDILIRDVSAYPMLGNYFRISVGTPEENDQLLASLRKILGGREQ